MWCRTRFWLLGSLAVWTTGCIVVSIPTGSRVVTVRSVDVDIDVKARAAALAAAIAPRLAELERWFERRRAEGLRDPRSARRLVDRTEERLLEILEADELTALRDLVQQEIALARTWTEEARRRDQVASTLPAGLRLASVRPVSQLARLPVRSLLADALDRVGGLLGLVHRRAAAADLLVDVCVVSDPTGAAVELYPSTDPQDLRSTRTDAVLQHVYRGGYSYVVTRDGYRTSRCIRPCYFDLLHPRQPLLECDLEAGDEGATASPCRELDQPDPRCPVPND